MHVPSEEFGVPEAIALGYENTMFPFIILDCCILMATALVLLEKLRSLILGTNYQKNVL